MKMFVRLLSLLLLLFAIPSHAEDVVKVFGSVNGVFFDGAASNDIEAGFNARASLSPHISIVADATHGFVNDYTQAGIGPRFTATDAADYSVGIGFKYKVCTDEELRPKGTYAEAAVGWKPRPLQWPKVYLGVGADYGPVSLTGSDPEIEKQASVKIAARYAFGSF